MECSACAQGIHHRCRRVRCDCPFPVHPTPGTAAPPASIEGLADPPEWRQVADAATVDDVADFSVATNSGGVWWKQRPRRRSAPATLPPATPATPAVLSHVVTAQTALVALVPSGPWVTGRTPPPAPEVVERVVERVRVERVEVEKLVPLEVVERAVYVDKDRRQTGRWLADAIVTRAGLDPALAEAAARLLKVNGWSEASARLLARVLVDELCPGATEPPRGGLRVGDGWPEAS